MSEEDLIRIPGYECVGIQKDVCGSRPTLIGHRLEPRHFVGMSAEEITAGWPYLSSQQVEEARRFVRDFPETLDPDADRFPALEAYITHGGR